MINKDSKMWNFNKRELDIFWGSILGTIGLIILILFLIFILSGHSCDTKTEINNTYFYGTVKKIYVDTFSHNSHILELVDKQNKLVVENLDFYYQEFINNIKVGDTLFSKKGSPYVTIRRKDTILKFLKYLDY